MGASVLEDYSMDFAVKIVKLCESIRCHFSIVNQLERSATSIGANICEAHYAHSRADFIAKMQISLHEAQFHCGFATISPAEGRFHCGYATISLTSPEV